MKKSEYKELIEQLISVSMQLGRERPQAQLVCEAEARRTSERLSIYAGVIERYDALLNEVSENRIRLPEIRERLTRLRELANEAVLKVATYQ